MTLSLSQRHLICHCTTAKKLAMGKPLNDKVALVTVAV